MTIRFDFRSLILTSIAAAMVLALSSCDRDDETPLAASSVSVSDGRPPELVQAYGELQANQPAQAYATAQVHLNGPYRAEALYLTGKALADQGQFQQGKERIEECIGSTHQKTLKALAHLARADCNMGLEDYHLASRQYHWVEVNYKDVPAIHMDEVMFKLGMASKKAGNIDWANHWFNQVNELYNSGPYAERARRENTHFTPPPESTEKPLVYFLEVEAYSSREHAEEIAADLRAKRYRDVEIVASTRNSKKVWEVRVGKFNSRNAAGRAQVDAQLAGLSTNVRPGTVEPIH